MAERSARKVRDPIAVALAFAIRRAVQRKAEAQAERRRTMTVVEGAKRDGGAA